MRPAAALLGLLALASAAQAGGLLSPVGPVLAAAGAGGVLLGDAPAETQTLVNYNCGGTAPLTTACVQEVTGAPGTGYALFTAAGTGFTGTIVATLVDGAGNSRSWACTYFVFVGGVTPGPSCSASGGELQGGSLRLLGAVGDTGGTPAAGYWEVGVVIG